MGVKIAYSIRSLTYSYDEKVVLDIPGLDIPKGHINLFTGPNGSGKTTLLSILALLRAPSGGTGRAVADVPRHPQGAHHVYARHVEHCQGVAVQRIEPSDRMSFLNIGGAKCATDVVLMAEVARSSCGSLSFNPDIRI